MATNSSTPGTQPALLFMPDITGFTEFVSATEITHAQSVIKELLEVIIDSNRINLKVSEIEGDAIFFYRPGEPPSFEQLLEQVQIMFIRFHQHLQLYDHQRICPCEACCSAVNLKLKIIAHYGEVSGYSVNKYEKLFGREVIVAHRLLKNNLHKKEYALLTNSLLEGFGNISTYPDWYLPEEAVEQYDVGEIRFQVSDLTPLRSQLPLIPAQTLDRYTKTKTAFSEEVIIPISPEKIFGTICDLTQRAKWMTGLNSIKMLNHQLINRIGTQHLCVFGTANNPLMVTEYARIGTGEAILVEMERKGMGGCRYLVKRLGPNETQLKIDFLVKNNFILLAFFNLFMKNKQRKQLKQSIKNLIEYCNDQFVRARPVTEQPVSEP